MPKTIRLFGYWRSQAAYRVRIALALKGLAFEETTLDLLAGEQFSDEFNALNPQQAVPVLIDDGPPLTQSLAIIEYLEARYPQPPLFPRDPHQLAIAKSFALISITDSHPFQVPRVRKYLANRLKASETDIMVWAQHWQKEALRAMEFQLEMRQEDTMFCYGNQPGIADIGLASQVAGAMTFDTPMTPYPRVTRIFERCLELEAFARHSPQALKPADNV